MDQGEYIFSENVLNLEDQPEVSIEQWKEWLEESESKLKLQTDPNYSLESDLCGDTTEYVSLPNMGYPLGEPYPASPFNVTSASAIIPSTLEAVEPIIIASPAAPVQNLIVDTISEFQPDFGMEMPLSYKVEEPSASENLNKNPANLLETPVSTNAAPKPAKRRKRTTPPKEKLYQRETPFADPKLERNRLNAQKAKRNRDKKDQELGELKKKCEVLMQTLAEKDKIIQQLHQEKTNCEARYKQQLLEMKNMVDRAISHA